MLSHILFRALSIRLVALPALIGLMVLYVILGDRSEMTMAMPAVFMSHSSNLSAEVAQIRKVLKLKPGDAYGEIGGGSGLLFAELAPSVMPGGKVYGTGKTADEIDAMRTAAVSAGATSASLFIGKEQTTGLPKGCCDVIVMRIVYHMLSEPIAYLGDLRSALKPGGRLLILEHEPNTPTTSRTSAKVQMIMMGKMMNMAVVPSAAMLVEGMAAGFAVETDAFPLGIVQPWPYFNITGQYASNTDDARGYAILFRNPP